MLQSPNCDFPENITISVAQSPKIARMSGLLETNTLRLLDPPLIVELNVAGGASKAQLDAIGKSYVCQINLFDAETGQNADCLVEMVGQGDGESYHSMQYSGGVARKIRNLVGSTAVNAMLLKASQDFDAKRKLFFVFPHLSVRLPGKYYFSCVASKLRNRIDLPDLQNQIHTLHLSTDTFEVFTPHSYPGNLDITELSRALHRQGVNIRGGNYSTCPKRKYGLKE